MLVVGLFFTLPMVFLLLCDVRFLFAASRAVWLDEDKDGQAETQVFYENNQIVKTEVDKNGDKKPDIFSHFKNGKRLSMEADKDFDGQTDAWYRYNSKGNLIQSATDTNKDRKPDQFKEYLEGQREFVIREYDRNFDGKIDKRFFTQWKPDHKIPVYSNGRMNYIPNPSYVVLKTEEDNDFDGLIDVYTERGNKAASQSKVGQPINVVPDKPAEKNPEEDPEQSMKNDKKEIGTPEERRIRRMNETHGIKE